MKIKLGLYQHYKGGKYRLIGLAKHRDTLEDFVVYETLYDNPVSKLWVGPAEVFRDYVEWEGKKVKRFKYIGFE